MARRGAIGLGLGLVVLAGCASRFGHGRSILGFGTLRVHRVGRLDCSGKLHALTGRLRGGDSHPHGSSFRPRSPTTRRCVSSSTTVREPKRLVWYDANHGLDGSAYDDRLAWLGDALGN